jgi:hypothetical protein
MGRYHTSRDGESQKHSAPFWVALRLVGQGFSSETGFFITKRSIAEAGLLRREGEYKGRGGFVKQKGYAAGESKLKFRYIQMWSTPRRVRE